MIGILRKYERTILSVSSAVATATVSGTTTLEVISPKAVPDGTAVEMVVAAITANITLDKISQWSYLTNTGN